MELISARTIPEKVLMQTLETTKEKIKNIFNSLLKP